MALADEEKLDSVTETVIALTLGDSDTEVNPDESLSLRNGGPSTYRPLHNCMFTTSMSSSIRGDILDGPILRSQACKKTAEKVEQRIEESLRSFYSSTIDQVTTAVHSAYACVGKDIENGSQLLPYTEIPTIAVSGIDISATTSVLDSIYGALVSGSSFDQTFQKSRPVHVSELTPADCGTLTTAMKSLISGFTRTSGIDSEDDECHSRPLAAYDINILKRWYARHQRMDDVSTTSKLVVLISEFERIEPSIMQDVFYICSLHVPQLPIVFVLGQSVPSTTSYLHTTYSRSTLSLLRLSYVDIQGGIELLNKILFDTFFDPTFDAPVHLGSSALSFLVERFQNGVQSIDYVTTVLRLLLLRHYTDPFSALMNDVFSALPISESVTEMFDTPEARTFLLALLSRLHHPNKTSNPDLLDDTKRENTSKGKRRAASSKHHTGSPWLAQSPSEVLRHFNLVQEKHKTRQRGLSVAFRIVIEARQHILDAGLLKAERGSKRPATIGELMISALRGTITGREGDPIKHGLRRLPLDRLSSLISALLSYIHSLPELVLSAESNTLEQLADWNARLNNLTPDDEAREISSEIGEWLVELMSERFVDYTDDPFWDLWYVGNPQGITEILNPAPRSTIISALVHPERYLCETGMNPGDNAFHGQTKVSTSKNKKRLEPNGIDARSQPVATIPDTCVAFQRYLEGGRMVNVYDWFAAFSGTLKAQEKASKKIAKDILKEDAVSRENMTTRGRGRGRGRGANRAQAPSQSPSPSPSKGRGRGRGRPRGRGRGPNGVSRRGTVADDDLDHHSSLSGSSSDEDGDDDEVRTEKVAQMHARFLRTVQELDFLGFIKHTGRRAEHIQKTVLEPAEF